MNKWGIQINTQRSNIANRIKLGIFIVLGILCAIGVTFFGYSDEVNGGLAQSLIRLHVIANSDTKEDQALKLKVRDAVITYMKKHLNDVKDKNEAERILKSHIPNIQKEAENEIRRNNKAYNVKMMVGKFPFPTKNYGDVSLPAGNYEALRVVIGNGEGKNWWCVLFPPLCFVDATHGVIPEREKQNLKQVLSEDEYDIITSANKSDDIPIKVKFKIVEVFQSSKVKVSSYVSNLF